MKIILTDSPKNCPEQLPDGYDLIKVDGSTIKRYDGNEDVAFVLCTRCLAATLVNEDIHLPSCRLVQLFSVGYDDVDVEKYQARDLPLCNAAGVYDNVLAEYVLYAMLLYAKRFHRSLGNRWFRPLRNYHYMTEIAGKTVGIMGCGRIGAAVARHLSGFGVSILGYAKNTKEKEGFSQIYHRDVIKEFFSQCDFVINTLPQDESTIGLIDASVLEAAKSTVVFINVGRDSVFSGDDFRAFLKTHKEAVAILDMFEVFPNPITNKYRRLANAFVMPRVSAISQESIVALKKLVTDNIESSIQGNPLRNRIV